MTYRTYGTDEFSLPLPIAQAAREIAEQFARAQPTPVKAEQVRRNTLAVWVVNDYLQMMGVPTDRDASDSWNPVMRLCADVADLILPGIGQLECRPVDAQAQTCPIPPEVWQERVGYVVVEVADNFQEAKLLGFVPTAAVEELPLNQLRSPEDLIDHLFQLRQSTVAQPSPQPTPAPRINLSQWFEGVVEAGWQTIDSLLNQPEFVPAYAFRGEDAIAFRDVQTGIRRLKLLHLGGQPGETSVILIVTIQTTAETSDSPIDIQLQLHPISQPQLPAGVQLIVLDETGTTFLEAESRPIDNFIQLQFSGTPGEVFSVQVALGEVRVVEAFVI
ncbi:DUF1822 family protein [Leptothermofonsia sichuanensis E412]|uniref:DUF1822 family protein n=1 Tax=Leptothermofonsia sichuanensis TaxID=2917832 RepID=UPI001CA64BB6|nr:DUF1822 family protein [Leptothermofonsia sichuanensis]QZZ19958.1 DUF1822 family protein [Leptothermofonsia sichuanensis E412]